MSTDWRHLDTYRAWEDEVLSELEHQYGDQCKPLVTFSAWSFVPQCRQSTVDHSRFLFPRGREETRNELHQATKYKKSVEAQVQVLESVTRRITDDREYQLREGSKKGMLEALEEQFLVELAKLQNGETARHVPSLEVIDSDEVLHQLVKMDPKKSVDDLREMLPGIVKVLEEFDLISVPNSILGGRKAVLKITGKGILYCRGDRSITQTPRLTQNVFSITNSLVTAPIVHSSPGVTLSNIRSNINSMNKTDHKGAFAEVARLVEEDPEIAEEEKSKSLELLEILTKEAAKVPTERSLPLVLQSLLESFLRTAQAGPHLQQAIQPYLPAIAGALGLGG